MAEARRDGNFVTSMLFVGSDGITYPVEGDENTGRLYVDLAGGSGTVTSVSVVSANGFAGTVATATTTPAITLSTTITGTLYGNGTAISASKLALTQPATGSTLTIADGKTLTASNTLTFTGTDSSSVNFGAGGTVLYTTSTVPLTVGTTTIASGTSTRILYDNAGVLGEYTLTGTGTVVAMQTAPTFATSITTPSVLATANDSGALGASGTAFSDLFLASGGVINWNAGDVTITHSANTLAFAGASSGYTFDDEILPSANDGAGLGAPTISWSDLFLASGAVISFANNNVVVTHSSGILTVSTGDLRVTTAGTDSTSVPTLSSTSTLTNKTISHTIEPASDDTYTGENMTGKLAGDTIAQWDAVYLDATSGRWEFTDADAAATAGGVLVGLAATSGTDGNALTVVTRGVVRNDGWAWTTVGAPLYLSTSPGALTETAPSGTDDVVRIVGYVLSDDCIYLNPSNDWITRT